MVSSNKDAPLVSIIIVTFNALELVRRCLESIKSNIRNVSYETIVVDNNSTDGTADALSMEFPNVVLVRSRQNLFFAEANNLGIQNATGEYIVLLNNDTEILVDAVELMAEYLSTNQSVAGVCGRLLNHDGKQQIGFNIKRFPSLVTLAGEILLLHHTPLIRRHFENYYCRDLNYEIGQFVQQPAAACLMIRRTVLVLTKFDPELRLYFNDVDLCKRMHDAGLTIWYEPRVKVFHKGGESVAILTSREWTFHYYRDMLCYAKKHFPRYCLYLLRIALVVGSVQRIFIGIFFRIFFPKKIISINSLGRPKSLSSIIGSSFTMLRIGLLLR